MIQPPFTDEHEVLRESIRGFLDRELAPHAQEWEDARWFPDEVFPKLAAQGLLGLKYPVQYGGQGGDYLHEAVLAEELDADWSNVRPIQPPSWDEKKYGNPEYGMTFQTSASASVRGYFKPARLAGAQARRVLLEAVAAKWNVPVGELSTQPGLVEHRQVGRRITYGEIAAFAQAPVVLPKIEDKDLKDPASFRLIGEDGSEVALEALTIADCGAGLAAAAGI